MPNISSSGNIRPQSITTMSSPYSKQYMFLPISPTPPSGMMRSGVLGSGIRGGIHGVARFGDQKRVSWEASSAAGSAAPVTVDGAGSAADSGVGAGAGAGATVIVA